MRRTIILVMCLATCLTMVVLYAAQTPAQQPAVRVRKTDGTSLSGHFVARTEDGILLRTASGSVETVFWRQIIPADILMIHDRVLSRDDAAGWDSAVELLADRNDPEPLAKARQRMRHADALRQDAAQKRIMRTLAEKTDGASEGRPAFTVPSDISKKSSFPYPEYNAVKKNRKTLYRLMWRDILIAERMFAEKDVERRRWALGLIRHILYYNTMELKDPAMGSDLATAYLLPNVDAAQPIHWKILHKEQILLSALHGYKKNKEIDYVIRLYKMALVDPENRNHADGIRYRLSFVYQEKGNLDKALEYLDQIDLEASYAGGAKIARQKILNKLVKQEKSTGKPVTPSK